MSLPKNLRRIREKWGLKVWEMAELFGIKRSTYGKYEVAKAMPKIDFLIKLQDLTHINIKDLVDSELTNDDIPKKPLDDPIPTQLKFGKNIPKLTKEEIETLETLLAKIKRT